MNFVGIILALLGERLIGQFPRLGEYAFASWSIKTLRGLLKWPAFWNSQALPLLLIAPVVWLVYFAQGLMTHPISELVFSTLILLLCLGPRDLADDVHRWLDSRETGDSVTAERVWRGLMRGPEPDPSHRTVLGALFIQSHERLFGVLIWFFVCGPAGAVAYRVASRLPRALHEHSDGLRAQQVAEAFHGLMAWVPARITALLFGLAGSLDDALKTWKRLSIEPHEWRSHTWALLAEVSASSLDMEEPDGAPVAPATLQACLEEVLNMQLRALFILLAFCAIFTTGSIL